MESCGFCAGIWNAIRSTEGLENNGDSLLSVGRTVLAREIVMISTRKGRWMDDIDDDNVGFLGRQNLPGRQSDGLSWQG